MAAGMRRQVMDAFLAAVNTVPGIARTVEYDRPFDFAKGPHPAAWAWDFEEKFGIEKFSNNKWVSELVIGAVVAFKYAPNTDNSLRRRGNDLMVGFIGAIMNDATLDGLVWDLEPIAANIVDLAEKAQNIGAIETLFTVKYFVKITDLTLQG